MSRVLLLTVLLFCTAPILLQPSTLTNEHLIFTVDDSSGRLAMAVRNGIDQNSLLFYDQPPSSYTLIYTDDDLFVFGSDDGGFSRRPTVVDRTIETVWGNGLVNVTQTVRFVQREETGVEDGLLLSYKVVNTTSRNMEVGIRILYDTYLGEKDTFHFVFADGSKLEYEAEFETHSMPRSWISRGEKRDEPCLRGVLEGRLVTPSRKVVFANYKSLFQNPVQYRILENHRFHNRPHSRNDSAVALYYGPTSLMSGESVTYSTILGLCGEGEYVLEGHDVVLEEEKVEPPVTEPPVTEPLARRDEVEKVLKDIGDIQLLRESMEQLNALIDELNRALEGGEAQMTEERLAEIQQALKDMAEQ